MDFAYQPEIAHHFNIEDNVVAQESNATSLNVQSEQDVDNKKYTITQRLREKQLSKTGIFLKQKAFNSMQALEGWCSREKASVLIDLILATKPTTVVEIGVFGGKSLVPMALALRHTSPGGVIYGIDPWTVASSAEGQEGANLDWWTSVDHDYVLNSLIKQIQLLDLQKEVNLIRATSEDCPPIPNIDILHIDGNHSEKTSTLDVTKWVPYVKDGGLIIFDDIDWTTTNAATAWLDEHCHKLIEFKGENVWGIWIK